MNKIRIVLSTVLCYIGTSCVTASLQYDSPRTGASYGLTTDGRTMNISAKLPNSESYKK